MRIYINTAGFTSEDDYRWKWLPQLPTTSILPEGKEPSIPSEENDELPARPNASTEPDASADVSGEALVPEEANDVPSSQQRQQIPPFVYDEQIRLLRNELKFSVVLLRVGEQLSLLVTGLPAGKRKDYLNRNIRNSLACLGELSEERVLRGIAVAALRGQLESLLDESITTSSAARGGFEAAPELVSRLQGLVATGEENVQHPENRYGHNSEQLRDELADELERERLPEREGVLAIVTTQVAPGKFAEAQVWRGLSDLIKVGLDDGGAHWCPLPLPPATAGTSFGWLVQFLLRVRLLWSQVINRAM